MRNVAAGTFPLRSPQRRGASRSFIVAGTLATLSVSLTACGGGTPTSPTVGSTSSVSAPTLLSPINGGYVQQNDAATNCRYDPFYGYGFVVTFAWTAPGGKTAIDSYDIELKHPDASVPLLAQRVQATKYLYVACNIVVGQQGWQWKVRARTSDGRESQWSAPFYLNFTDCRLSSGLHCAEQPPQ